MDFTALEMATAWEIVRKVQHLLMNEPGKVGETEERQLHELTDQPPGIEEEIKVSQNFENADYLNVPTDRYPV